MKKYDIEKVFIKPYNILFASTSKVDYEMSRIILLEIEGKYILLTGGGSLWYDSGNVDWEAIEFTEEELKNLPLGYGQEEREAKEFIKRYFN